MALDITAQVDITLGIIFTAFSIYVLWLLYNEGVIWLTEFRQFKEEKNNKLPLKAIERIRRDAQRNQQDN